MRIPVIVFLLVLFPTLVLSQQALIEKGIAEFYVSGAGGVGKRTLLYGGELGIGLNGEAALSVAYAGVAHEGPTWYKATITPTLTFAFHTKNQSEQSIIRHFQAVLRGTWIRRCERDFRGQNGLRV